MAWWSAEVLIDPSDDDSGVEVVNGFVWGMEYPEDKDYRKHYRALLEAAFEAEPRIGQGHASSIRLG